jgi:hypothetical protein
VVVQNFLLLQALQQSMRLGSLSTLIYSVNECFKAYLSAHVVPAADQVLSA